jgi:hypothetical protein
MLFTHTLFWSDPMNKLFERIHAPLAVLSIMSIPHLIYAVSHWYTIPLHEGIAIGPIDPDSWLRLTLVRQWLTSGDWYNHTVPHANTPFTEPISPWTRPLDVIIAALVKLQPDTVELNLRLMRAALLLPWIWMTLLLGGIFRILRQIAPAPVSYLVAVLFVALNPMVWNYFGLANADHHAPLAVLFMWSIGGILHPSPSKRSMVITGMLFGLQLWISMEATILICIVYLRYGLHWSNGKQAAAEYLAVLSSSVAFTSLVALMVERPKEEWFTPIYDANSVVYVTLMTLLAILAWQIKLTRATHPFTKMITAIVCSSALIGFFFALFPKAIRGPLTDVTPFVLHDLLPHISEVRPLYTDAPLNIVASCFQPLLVLIILLAAWKFPRYSLFKSRQVADLAFFSLALFILFVSQRRWCYYSYPFLALTIAPFLAALFEPEHPVFAGKWPATTMVGLSETSQALRRSPIAFLALGLPVALMHFNSALDKRYGNAEVRLEKDRRNGCYDQLRIALRSGALIRIHNKESLSILAPTDLGTEILFFTNHRIVASNYHREGDAIEYVWGANTITNKRALREYLEKRGIEMLLICPELEHPSNSVLQGIAAGEVPPRWLEPVDISLSPTPAQAKEEAQSSSSLLQAIPRFLFVKAD